MWTIKIYIPRGKEGKVRALLISLYEMRARQGRLINWRDSMVIRPEAIEEVARVLAEGGEEDASGWGVTLGSGSPIEDRKETRYFNGFKFLDLFERSFNRHK